MPLLTVGFEVVATVGLDVVGANVIDGWLVGAGVNAAVGFAVLDTEVVGAKVAAACVGGRVVAAALGVCVVVGFCVGRCVAKTVGGKVAKIVGFGVGG